MASPSRLPASSRSTVGCRSRPMSLLEGPLNLEPPKQDGTSTKQAKRRSLLPTFSRKVSNEEQTPIQEESELGDDVHMANSRPASVTESEPRRAMEEQDRKAMPPPPSRLSRPSSLYGSTGLGRTPSLRTPTREAPKSRDSRVEALAALEGRSPATPSSRIPPPMGDVGLKRASSTRLAQVAPVRGLARTASVKSKDTTSHIRTSASASGSIPTTAAKRSSINRSRPSSVVEPVSPRKTPPQASKLRALDSRQLPAPSRPAFSTYQQHYSPAKSALPKPPIPSTQSSHRPPSASTTPTPDPPVDFETFQRQIELLQLSLLHQSSISTSRDYTSSAHRQLSKKHAKIRKDLELVRTTELEQQRIHNLSALDNWCPDAALLAEALHVLNKVYSDIIVLSEPGSKFTYLVDVFEEWIDQAEASFLNGHDAFAPKVFLQALPDEWRRAHTSLALRLRSSQRELEMLPPPQHEDNGQDGGSLGDIQTGSSSLELVYSCCVSLVDGMLRELDVMHKLEREVLAREKAKVEDEVKSILVDGDHKMLGYGEEKWVPAWQRV